jgi:hypothetical protein
MNGLKAFHIYVFELWKKKIGQLIDFCVLMVALRSE